MTTAKIIGAPVKPDICVVCSDPLSSTDNFLSCGHSLHPRCTLPALNVGMRCPVCTQDPLDAKKLSTLPDHAQPPNQVFMPFVIPGFNGRNTFV